LQTRTRRNFKVTFFIKKKKTIKIERLVLRRTK
jgi:hypothetical protein